MICFRRAQSLASLIIQSSYLQSAYQSINFRTFLKSRKAVHLSRREAMAIAKNATNKTPEKKPEKLLREAFAITFVQFSMSTSIHGEIFRSLRTSVKSFWRVNDFQVQNMPTTLVEIASLELSGYSLQYFASSAQLP